MSEPSYRITTEYDPTEPDGLRWQARIVSLADGSRVATSYGHTEELALEAALAHIAALAAPRPSGGVYFANEDGSLDPATPAPDGGEVA